MGLRQQKSALCPCALHFPFLGRNSNEHTVIYLCMQAETCLSGSTMGWCKFGEIAFPTSRNVNEHTLLALGSDHMARMISK